MSRDSKAEKLLDPCEALSACQSLLISHPTSVQLRACKPRGASDVWWFLPLPRNGLHRVALAS